MARKDSTAELVGLALPRDPHPGAFESEVEAADPGEEGADIHAVRL